MRALASIFRQEEKTFTTDEKNKQTFLFEKAAVVAASAKKARGRRRLDANNSILQTYTDHHRADVLAQQKFSSKNKCWT